jgi:hypothetical protein
MYTYRHIFSALMLLLSMTARAQNIAVSLQPEFGGEQLTDGAWFVTRFGDSVQITAFRFYISGFSVDYADGSSARETDSYHLADAFDPATLQFDLSGAQAGAVTGIRFNIGVDSAKSVSGVFGGDLDPVNGMYWAWNSGYIDAKLEGTRISHRRLPAAPTHAPGGLSSRYDFRNCFRDHADRRRFFLAERGRACNDQSHRRPRRGCRGHGRCITNTF